jgi:hypothetical protein
MCDCFTLIAELKDGADRLGAERLLVDVPGLRITLPFGIALAMSD